MKQTAAAIALVLTLEGVAFVWFGIDPFWTSAFAAVGTAAIAVWVVLALRRSAESEPARTFEEAQERVRSAIEALRSLSPNDDAPLSNAIRRMIDACEDVLNVLEKNPSRLGRAWGFIDYALPKGVEIARAYAELTAAGSLSSSERSHLDAARDILIKLPGLYEEHLRALREGDVKALANKVEALQRIALEFERPTAGR